MRFVLILFLTCINLFAQIPHDFTFLGMPLRRQTLHWPAAGSTVTATPAIPGSQLIGVMSRLDNVHPGGFGMNPELGSEVWLFSAACDPINFSQATIEANGYWGLNSFHWFTISLVDNNTYCLPQGIPNHEQVFCDLTSKVFIPAQDPDEFSGMVIWSQAQDPSSITVPGLGGLGQFFAWSAYVSTIPIPSNHLLSGSVFSVQSLRVTNLANTGAFLGLYFSDEIIFEVG